MTPTTTRPSPGASTLPDLFLAQLAWLDQGSLETNRHFAGWLDAGLPSGLSSIVAQSRRVSTRHRALLRTELIALTLTLPRTENLSIRAALADGDACLDAPCPEAVRNAGLVTTIDRLASSFSTACASAAETATVLGREELAKLLAVWAETWREIATSLHETSFTLTDTAYLKIES